MDEHIGHRATCRSRRAAAAASSADQTTATQGRETPGFHRSTPKAPWRRAGLARGEAPRRASGTRPPHLFAQRGLPRWTRPRRSRRRLRREVAQAGEHLVALATSPRAKCASAKRWSRPYPAGIRAATASASSARPCSTSTSAIWPIVSIMAGLSSSDRSNSRFASSYCPANMRKSRRDSRDWWPTAGSAATTFLAVAITSSIRPCLRPRASAMPCNNGCSGSSAIARSMCACPIFASPRCQKYCAAR